MNKLRILALSSLMVTLLSSACGRSGEGESLLAQQGGEERASYVFHIDPSLRESIQKSCYGLLYVWAGPQNVEIISEKGKPYVLRALITDRLAKHYEKATVAVSGTNEVYRCVAKVEKDGGKQASESFFAMVPTTTGVYWGDCVAAMRGMGAKNPRQSGAVTIATHTEIVFEGTRALAAKIDRELECVQGVRDSKGQPVL